MFINRGLRAPAAALVVLVAALSAAGASGYTLPGVRSFGDPVSGQGARSMAMGGTGIAADPGLGRLFVNPALLGFARRGRIEASLGVARPGEVRTQEVFDSFDNTVGEATLAANTSYYIRPALWGVMQPLGRFVVAAGGRERYDFDYDFHQEIRDNFYYRLGSRDLVVRGGLYEWSLGVGMCPSASVGLGAAVNLLRGDAEWRWEVEDSSVDTTETSSANLDGWDVTVGAAARIGERVVLGLMARRGAEVGWEAESGSIDDATVDYPPLLGAGLEVTPANQFPAILSWDVLYIPWSDLTVDGEEADLDDVWEVRFGVEHEMTDGLLVRIGFRWEPSYVNEEIAQAVVATGLGWEVKGFGIDLATELGRRGYRSSEVTASDVDFPEPVEVEETLVRLAATVWREF